jgi:hypothetical protein
MHHTQSTRASEKVTHVSSAHSAMRRPFIGLAVGAVLAAAAAAGVVAAPAIAAPSDVDVHRASVAEDAGRIALTNAVALNNVVEASGLRDEATLISVDIDSLKRDVTSIDAADGLSGEQLADLTDDVVHGTVGVQQKTADLQEALTTAKEAKAAEQARLRAEAERIAAEKAAEEKRRAAEALAAANTPSGAKATASRIAAERYGWGSGQFSCLSNLWNKESGWNYQAYNRNGGATGIPQALPGSKMATAGSDWRTSAATQISWGLDYIKRAYGSPCSAWSHSQAVNWY